jgi:hypothetical protein
VMTRPSINRTAFVVAEPESIPTEIMKASP